MEKKWGRKAITIRNNGRGKNIRIKIINNNAKDFYAMIRRDYRVWGSKGYDRNASAST